MDPTENINFYKFGVFYYNPDDSRTLVPKRIKSTGYQVNFAKSGSLVFILLIILLLIVLSIRWLGF